MEETTIDLDAHAAPADVHTAPAVGAPADGPPADGALAAKEVTVEA